jgi:formamidopyrimidine-DNA glycosylase
MKQAVQRCMHCSCGRATIVALDLCATCYTLKRQDQAYFGGLREQVLARDGLRCRACGKPRQAETLAGRSSFAGEASRSVHG